MQKEMYNLKKQKRLKMIRRFLVIHNYCSPSAITTLTNKQISMALQSLHHSQQ